MTNKKTTTTAFIMLLLAVPTTVHVSYAQFGSPQQLQGEGEQVESDDGGLTATLNGETFTQGDPITVRGTVGEKEGGSLVYITIVDPDGIKYGTWTATVTNDLTFTFGFIAGQPSGETRNLSMDKFGTYTIMLMYALQDRERVEIETTDVSFEYVNGITTTPSATGTETNTTTTTEEEAEGKSAYELQLEAIQAFKEQEDLTPEHRKQVEFLEKQLIAQEQLSRELDQQQRELGLGGPSSSPAPYTPLSEDTTTEETAETAETNATTMTLEEAEAAIANATRVIEEAEYKIEKAEEVIAIGEVIGAHTPRILGHAIGVDTQLKNNNTQGAFEKLDLIFAELKSLSGNLTSMKEATE